MAQQFRLVNDFNLYTQMLVSSVIWTKAGYGHNYGYRRYRCAYQIITVPQNGTLYQDGHDTQKGSTMGFYGYLPVLKHGVLKTMDHWNRWFSHWNPTSYVGCSSTPCLMKPEGKSDQHPMKNHHFPMVFHIKWTFHSYSIAIPYISPCSFVQVPQYSSNDIHERWYPLGLTDVAGWSIGKP